MALLEDVSRQIDLDKVMTSLRLSSRKDGPCDRATFMNSGIESLL